MMLSTIIVAHLHVCVCVLPVRILWSVLKLFLSPHLVPGSIPGLHSTVSSDAEKVSICMCVSRLIRASLL